MRFLERSSSSGITPIALVSERSWAPNFVVERNRGEGGLLEKNHVNSNYHIKDCSKPNKISCFITWSETSASRSPSSFPSQEKAGLCIH